MALGKYAVDYEMRVNYLSGRCNLCLLREVRFTYGFLVLGAASLPELRRFDHFRKFNR